MPVQFDATYPSLAVFFDFPAPIGRQDVTEYVRDLDTFIGRMRNSDRFDGSGSMLLENWDARFSPANLSGPYVSGGVSFVRPKVGVAVVATWAGTDYPVFTGEVKTWRPDWIGNADVEGQDSLTAVTFTGRYTQISAWVGQPVDPPVGEGERSGARISRLLTAIGFPGPTSLAIGNVPMLATTLAGNGMQQILDVVDAEGGAFWIDPDGTAVFEDRSSLVINTRSNTSQVTFSEMAVYVRNVEFPETTDDLIFNDVTFQREGGEPQSASDATSQSLYGIRSLERTGLPAAEDVHMLSAAQWNVARRKDPEDRVEAVTIDPASAPALMWPHALGRRIHDRATVTVVNARSGQTVSHDVFIEGVAHSISQFRWETTFYFSSATAWTSFSADRWDVGVWDTARWFY